MGPHRNCKQKPQSKKSNSKLEATGSKINLKRKKVDSAKENETVSHKLQKVPSNNISILKYLRNASYGNCFCPAIKKFHKICILNHFLENQAWTTMCPFERRVTAIEWHPQYPNIFVSGSKGGELSLYNSSIKNNTGFINGIGPGGSIVGLKFSLDNVSSVYTASITGKLRQEHFDSGIGKTLLSTFCFRNWFSSLDVSRDKKLILAGDTVGNCYLLNTERDQKVWPDNTRLHKDKVSHVEFCTLDPNIFVTASIDHSVRLWDLRMLFSSDLKPNPLCTFTHLKGVNSAHFSPCNRNSLLTTDQHSQIRVYKTPGWSEEIIIPHPHRQFQHLTPIKATWHPLEDIIVVGRYPHDEFLKGDTRSIDFIDGSTGELLSKVKSSTGGILSLNSFNITGDCLASTAGNSVIFTTRSTNTL